MKSLINAVVGLGLMTLLGCSPPASSLKKVMEENPDIVLNVIEKNPKKFFEVVAKAQREAQMAAQEEEKKAEQDRLETEFKNPKKPNLSDNRVTFGPKQAPITIVEYSDFECPFCQRGYNTMKEVQKEYGEKVKVIFKHLPLDFHPMAMPSAKYYEAIAKQDPSKAQKFHDMVFENQQELKAKKEDFLKEVAKKVGANMSQVQKDLNSPAVTSVIEADIKEANSFGFNGTPGYLVNGVSIRGAYPLPEFKKIIDRHLGGDKK